MDLGDAVSLASYAKAHMHLGQFLRYVRWVSDASAANATAEIHVVAKE